MAKKAGSAKKWYLIEDPCEYGEYVAFATVDELEEYVNGNYDTDAAGLEVIVVEEVGRKEIEAEWKLRL